MSHYFHCQEAEESSWIVLPEFSDDYRLASTPQSSSIAVVSSKFNDEAKTAEDIKLLSMPKSVGLHVYLHPFPAILAIKCDKIMTSLVDWQVSRDHRLPCASAERLITTQ